jgi:hypothetical protein
MAEIQEYVNDWYKGRAVYKRMAAIFADINHAICYVCEPKTPLLTEKGLPSPDGLYDSFVLTDFNSNHPWDMVSKPQMELMAEYFVLFLQGFPTGKSDEPKLIKGQVQTLQEVMTADKFGMSQRVLDLWVARTYFIHIQGEGCNWDLLYRHCQTFSACTQHSLAILLHQSTIASRRRQWGDSMTTLLDIIPGLWFINFCTNFSLVGSDNFSTLMYSTSSYPRPFAVDVPEPLQYLRNTIWDALVELCKTGAPLMEEPVWDAIAMKISSIFPNAFSNLSADPDSWGNTEQEIKNLCYRRIRVCMENFTTFKSYNLVGTTSLGPLKENVEFWNAIHGQVLKQLITAAYAHHYADKGLSWDAFPQFLDVNVLHTKDSVIGMILDNNNQSKTSLGSYINTKTGKVYYGLQFKESSFIEASGKCTTRAGQRKHVIVGMYEKEIDDQLIALINDPRQKDMRIERYYLRPNSAWSNVSNVNIYKIQVENFAIFHAFGYLIRSFHVKNSLLTPCFAFNRFRLVLDMTSYLGEMGPYYAVRTFKRLAMPNT